MNEEKEEPKGMDNPSEQEKKMPVDKGLVNAQRKERVGDMASPPITSGEFTPLRPLGAKQLIYILDITNLVWVGLDGQDKGDMMRKQDAKAAKDKDCYPDTDFATGFKTWIINFSGNWIIDAVTGAQAPGIQLMQYYYDNAISPIKVMLVAPGNAEPSYTGEAIITEWDQPGPVEGVVTYTGSLQGKLGYTTANIF